MFNIVINYSKYIALLFLAVFFIPIVITAIYSLPILDDFLYANKVLEHGLWQAQSEWYLLWTGRVGGTFFISLASVYLEELYGIICLMNILFFCSTFGLLLHASINDSKRKHFLLYYAFFITVVVVSLPGIEEGFFFLSAFGNYTLPLSFLFIFLFIHIKKPHLVYINVPLLLWLCTFNEFYTLFILAYACSCIANTYFKEKRISWINMIYLLMIVMGLIIMYLSPGIAIRESKPYDEVLSNNIRNSIFYSIRHILIHIDEYILTFRMIAFALVFSILPKSKELRSICDKLHPLSIITPLVFCITSYHLIHFYYLGTGVTDRGENALYILCLFSLCVLLVKYRNTIRIYVNRAFVKKTFLFIVFIAYVNIEVVYMVFSMVGQYNVISFSEKFQNQRNNIEAAALRGEDNYEAYVMSHIEAPEIFHYHEIEPDSRWMNEIVKFYRLRHEQRQKK